MAEYVQKIIKKAFTLIASIFKKDFVFTLSFILALASCFVYTPKASYIDFKVLISLFNLMIIVKAFEELHLLDKAAIIILNKCSTSKSVSFILIFLCFFSSMLITNDVALLTFVPLTLIISKHSGIPMMRTVIFQTLAANIGSSLTPMGNPQNLYIFSYYNLTSMQFFATIILLILAGGAWLILLNIKQNSTSLELIFPSLKIRNKTQSALWILLFFIVILSIFNVISFKAAFVITLLATLYLNKRLLIKIDYLLLVTFICFFIFIGNISNINAVNSFISGYLKDTPSTYLGSVLLSQFISNVPCAILLSKFTTHWKALLLGVNVGGMGTIIASLASVISYKLFIKENPGESRRYLFKFSVYNVLSLGVFVVVGYFILRVL